jgi:sulfatase maturation enzyme AslB (radical SAM superfamily)
MIVSWGEESVYSNEELIPRQRFPGELNPSLPDWSEYPIPDSVGEYGSREEFLRAPKFPAQWVHFNNRAKLVVEGRYFDIAPLHFEGIFTLVCNFRCPHCSRRETRINWVKGGTWDNNTPLSSGNTMTLEAMHHTLDNIASMRTDDYIGVVWGGGDPTANPYVYDAMLRAKSCGIKSSFITNGVFMEPDELLIIEPVLVRVSLNCGTEETYRKFHGYPKGWDYFDRVLVNMREYAQKKSMAKSKTLFGVSLIVDERNLDDVVAAADVIKEIAEKTGPGGIDYVIARPVMNYWHFEARYACVQMDTKSKGLSIMEGPVRHRLDSVGVPLVVIKDSFEQSPPPEYYDNMDSDCLSYGWASEVRHNGDIQLCSDSYGNPEYTIGNVFAQSLAEIWKSNRRKEVLRRINELNCWRYRCPFNGRGHHLNRTFHQVEQMRREGRLDEVVEWIAKLREVTFPLKHSFFL